MTVTQSRADRFRTPCRFYLPREVVDALEAEAARRQVSVERLVEEKLLERLPALLAEAARRYIASSVAMAAEIESAESSSNPAEDNAA